jgi:hypothetical protein
MLASLKDDGLAANGGPPQSSKGRDHGTLNPVFALAGPPRIFRRVPRLILPPFLEVGRAALWQIFLPCGFESRARGLETRRGAV